MQSGIKTNVSGSQKFSELMSAFSGTGAEVAGLASKNTQVASMTHAALTGAASAASPYSQAYMGTSSPFSSGGYAPSGTVGSGYSGGTYAGGTYGSAGGGIAGGGGLPTDPVLAQDYLLNKMRDTNMQMIQLQAMVQQESRRFQTSSNLIKAKYDMEINSVRNLRVG
jgi:uncharacterized membrane protein